MTPDITVLCATHARPSQLQLCMAQFAAQSLGNLTAELVVIHDGPWTTWRPAPLSDRIRMTETPTRGGMHGMAALDHGMTLARGEYVCMWNDDNEYFPHYLATLYALAACCQGIGVGLVHFPNLGGRILPNPWRGRFEACNCDQMNAMVRRAAIPPATRYMDFAGLDCTDWRFWHRLNADYRVPTVFAPVLVGRHL